MAKNKPDTDSIVITPKKEATVLNKRVLVIIAGAIATLVGGVYYYKTHDWGTAAPHVVKVRPATNNSHIAPPPPPAVTTRPVAPTLSTAPTLSAAPAQALPASTPAKAPVPQIGGAQYTAMVSGDTGSWSATAAMAPTPVPAQATPTPYTAPMPAPTMVGAAGAVTVQKAKQTDYSTAFVHQEASPYELLQGSIIPATLQTGISSDLPGQITAVVSNNVYTANGYLLVPAGSMLVGTYADAQLGMNRLAIAWTRIEFPNSTYINLPKAYASGSRGYSGIRGSVDDHTWLIFKNALLLSLVEAGAGLASPSSGTSNTGQTTGNTSLQTGAQSLAQTLGQVGASLLQKYINISPTIDIQAGQTVNVVVTKDMIFPGPYSSTATGLPATQANPYAPTTK